MALDASIMCYSEINVRTLAISLAWRVAGNVQCGLFGGSGSTEPRLSGAEPPVQ